MSDIVFLIEYKKCSNCKLILHDKGLKLSKLNTPCTHCGDLGVKELWPDINVIKYMEMLVTIKNNPDHYGIKISLLTSLFERLLKDTILGNILTHSKHPVVTDALIYKYKYKDDLLTLYKKTTNESINDSLKKDNHTQFAKMLTKLFDLRNEFTHGFAFIQFHNEINKTLNFFNTTFLDPFVVINNNMVNSLKLFSKS